LPGGAARRRPTRHSASFPHCARRCDGPSRRRPAASDAGAQTGPPEVLCACRPNTIAFTRTVDEARNDMEPKTTAIVLIEFQNDFTTPGGTLHDAVKSVMQTSKMLENTKQTVARARELGATIAHAPITFAEGYGEITSEPYGILKGVVDSKSFIKGSWGAHIVDDLEPQPHDIVIEGKRGLDTFASTNLDFILRSRGITTIALAGFLTNCCVESTMRSAYERGYDVVTLTDCTATLSEEEQRFAVEKNFPMFSHPMTHDAFLERLEGKELAVSSGRGYAN
jgi:nicotinamidase-related amidase